MPELPEVETTLRAISPLLIGQILVNVQAFTPKLRYPVPAVAHLTGQQVTGAMRRAKYILLALSGGQTLLIHLGMSGRLSTQKPETHGHFLLQTENHTVYLRDPRRFGLVLLVPTKEIEKHPLLSALGPEPLTSDFTAVSLHTSLKKISMPIKPALMLPKVVVGVGNIYASESLFKARISPLRKASSLSLKECTRLVEDIKATLQKAIETGGSSLRDYAQPNGQLGNFQNDFYVYDCTGKPCRVCQTPIQQVVQAQRSTFYCAKCQK